ncbi:MAG TPA: riboflavin synthase [Flavipsychrobacter sp.]|nr:riboflavin synthase [Flavipsychrobacter sp.]
MFTGIIETIATIASISKQGTNVDLWIESSIAQELKIDQSIAHNGVCLTVVEIQNDQYRVAAVAETLSKTNLAYWKVGDKINLERALKVGDRLDGHFVQGHVDATGICISKESLEGSWLFHFSFPEQYAALMIEKGSICINGVSLTAFNVGKNEFTVTIIPYTFQHTSFQSLQQKDIVNLEFDVLGKYLLRHKTLTQ